MISNTSNFAIRALIYLELYSSASEKAGIKKIASEMDIPAPFLGKVLQELVKSQLLSSTKGPNGGFYLAKPAIDISMMDVIEAIDGKETLGNCVIKSNTCNASTPCSMHQKLARLKRETKLLFASETIADLASEYREGKDTIRI